MESLTKWAEALAVVAAVCALAVSCAPAEVLPQADKIELQTAYPYGEAEIMDWDKVWTIVRQENDAYLQHLSEQHHGRQAKAQ